MTQVMNARELADERALELLAQAYEAENRPITAGVLRRRNIDSQGICWVRTECAIAAILTALKSSPTDPKPEGSE